MTMAIHHEIPQSGKDPNRRWVRIEFGGSALVLSALFGPLAALAITDPGIAQDLLAAVGAISTLAFLVFFDAIALLIVLRREPRISAHGLLTQGNSWNSISRPVLYAFEEMEAIELYQKPAHLWMRARLTGGRQVTCLLYDPSQRLASIIERIGSDRGFAVTIDKGRN